MAKSAGEFLRIAGRVERGYDPLAYRYLCLTAHSRTQLHFTWDALYAKSVAGTEIPVPYHHVPQTDPAKVSPMIQAYVDVMAGTTPRDQLPAINDIVLDNALADMSIRPKAGLDGVGIMTHMCGMCHNATLDQTISRASFDVTKLSTLSRAVKDDAIRRLQLPEAEAKHMPPSRFHILSDAERDLVIAELMK